jgi:hypothetical protein
VAFSVFLVAPWGDGAHCPCAVRHAANDKNFRSLFQMRLGYSRGGAARSQILNGAPFVEHGHDRSLDHRNVHGFRSASTVSLANF